jgi:hypothetical protein
MAQTLQTNKSGNMRGVKHNLSSLPEYKVWENMKNRCDNPNCPKYKIYGGRGIKYQSTWASFVSFFNDMGSRPSSKHQLDRINVNGGYCKENCRWATNKENCRNKRNNNLILGKTLSEWSELIGVKRSTLAQRFYVYKWDISKVLTK